jgi:hypothetical protein
MVSAQNKRSESIMANKTDILIQVVGDVCFFEGQTEAAESAIAELARVAPQGVLRWHLDSVKRQLKAAGYTVRMAPARKPVSTDVPDADLLAALGM